MLSCFSDACCAYDPFVVCSADFVPLGPDFENAGQDESSFLGSDSGGLLFCCWCKAEASCSLVTLPSAFDHDLHVSCRVVGLGSSFSDDTDSSTERHTDHEPHPNLAHRSPGLSLGDGLSGFGVVEAEGLGGNGGVRLDHHVSKFLGKHAVVF